MSDQSDHGPWFSCMIDGFIRSIGKTVALLNSIIVINILIQVVLRYGLGEGRVWIEELQWHFYGLCIMVGIPYCLVDETHIRLDIFYRDFSPRKKAFVQFFGMLLLVVPLMSILFMHGLSFVETAWRVGEHSEHPLGLPYRWIIKSVIPLSMALILLAALSQMVRSAVVILRKIKIEETKKWS